MNTVIKGTKTIAEYKRVREDMENLASARAATLLLRPTAAR